MLCFRDFLNSILNRDNYQNKFSDALKFSESKQFNLDSNITSTFDNEGLISLVKEIADLIPNELKSFDSGNGEIVNYGGGCGNTHPYIVSFIKQYHPKIMVNLTMGSVQTDNDVRFDFNQETFCDWISGNKPETLDCHTWITINDNIILDFTIGTYINTRVEKNILKDAKQHAYGGVIYGHPNNLKYLEIPSIHNQRPDNFTKLKYNPIVLGKAAFLKAAPTPTN